jgi:tetratricopeptide (TPR) repeat protein
MLINRTYGICFVIAILALTAKYVKADHPENYTLYNKANQFYQEAIYDSALVNYKKIEDNGFASSDLYYNIGNTYFKLNKLPSAILYYEKAKKLNANDDDIQHNLDLANSMIVDKIEAVPQLFFKQWWNWFYGMFRADTWAWLSILLLSATFMMAYLFFASGNVTVRKTSFFAGLVSLVLTIMSFGLASQKYYYTQRINEAIVFAPTITAKSAPSTNSVDLFVIHEGTKVLLLDEASGWSKIRLADGSIGWLQSEALAGI